MNKYISKILLTVFIACVAIGCDNVLSQKPLNSISSEAVWNDPALMQANLNDIYIGMGHGFNEIMLASMTDDAMFVHGYGTFKVAQGHITASDMGAFANSRLSYIFWDNLYARIRQANVFLKKTADYTGSEQAMVKRMRGQAYFLRAYFYMQLMRLWGGVPLITKVYGLDDKNYDVPRASFAETVKFIVENADSAAARLPLSYSNGANAGRATKGAALALKSRVLLYAASDLYNINPSGMPETGYKSASSSERRARWEAAWKAAKAVMNLGIYHLYKAHPAPGDSTAKNFSELFLSKSNSEIIMDRYFSLKISHPTPALYNGPNGYHGWAGNTPTQSLVDAFEMKDGSDFSWDNPKEAAHPYKNRDPRFYATILYDGANWRKRHEDAQAMDPYGIIQTFSKLILPDGSTLPGIDTREGPIQSWNGSYTHYYLRKFMNPAIDFEATDQLVPWPFFRYAEILLNYAEASIELGRYGQARNAINKLRVRAGMPKLSSSLIGKSLMKEYRQERRVEMAFEEQRFFDIRRWMIAPEVMGQDVQGIEITVHGKSRAERSTYHDYQYKLIDIQQRTWANKLYFLPIPKAEIDRNKNLVQNPGY